jgi:hypothetical protein
MTDSSKKLLENQALGFSRKLAEERLKRAGVKLGKGLNLPNASGRSTLKGDSSGALIKKLAGG